MKMVNASELFIKMVANSQKAMASEDENLIRSVSKIAEKTPFFEKNYVEMMNYNNEFMRCSLIKSMVMTLIELGIVENDCDLLNSEVSNSLLQIGVKSAVEEMTE